MLQPLSLVHNCAFIMSMTDGLLVTTNKTQQIKLNFHRVLITRAGRECLSEVEVASQHRLTRNLNWLKQQLSQLLDCIWSRKVW